MKINNKVLVFAVIVAAIITSGVYFFINSSIQNTDNTNYIGIWVAKTDIPSKTKIEESMIEQINLPKEYALEGAIKEKTFIIGKYTGGKILKGEQIVPQRLVQIDINHFAYQVPDGKIAVTIKVGDVAGVANLINCGDSIDVILFNPQKDEKSGQGTVSYPDSSKIILQKILVLAVDDQTYDGNRNNLSKEQTERKLTLAVNPADAEKLVLADETGKIRLGLRNPKEGTKFITPGAKVNNIAS